MKQTILTLLLFLASVLGKILIESPTPELVKVHKKDRDHWFVIQAQTGSFLKFEYAPYLKPPVHHHPDGRVKVRYYRYPEPHVEGEHEDGGLQPGSYWIMAIMPAMGAIASGIRVNDWTERTEFSHDTQQGLQDWLNYRTLDDDYTVVFLSDDYAHPTLKQFVLEEKGVKTLAKPVKVSRVKEN